MSFPCAGDCLITPSPGTCRTPGICLGYLSALVGARSDDLTVADLGLENLELEDLRSWLGTQQRAGSSRSSLARRAAAIKSFTAWLAEQGVTEKDAGARLSSPSPDSRLPHVLSVGDAGKLLDYAKDVAEGGNKSKIRNWAACELLYSSALRVSELTGLEHDRYRRRYRPSIR